MAGEYIFEIAFEKSEIYEQKVILARILKELPVSLNPSDVLHNSRSS
jgi:hypothetical protein